MHRHLFDRQPFKQSDAPLVSPRHGLLPPEVAQKEPIATMKLDTRDGGSGAAASARPAVTCSDGDRKSGARRVERGSLFARLRLGSAQRQEDEEASTEPIGSEPNGSEQQLDQSAPVQQLEAMSEQLEAVTACMRVEQQARCAAEAELEDMREQVGGLRKHLAETERVRKEEACTLSGLRGLLEQLQRENAVLKEQNASLVGQCRSFMAASKPPPAR